MTLNILNQNDMSPKFGSFMTSMFSLRSDNNSNINNNAFYAKKGEPMYQEAMDSDDDGIVTFDEFKTYCKENNISAKDMKDMIEMRMAYRMSQSSDKEKTEKAEEKELPTGNLDLIYAKDGDGNYKAELDINNDSKVSYYEYLRYCEQNARMEAKNSDTKVVEDNKSKFMTRSFGHISNAYHKVIQDIPEGKIESKA